MDIYTLRQSFNYFCYLHLMTLGNVEFRYETIKDRWMKANKKAEISLVKLAICPK